MVTLGLFSYEIYGIAKCHALINVGKAMEASLRLAAGQFENRPREVLRHVNEPFAAAIIYPATMAAWTYLAAFDTPRWLARPLQLRFSSWASRPSSSTTAGHARTPPTRTVTQRQRRADGVGLHSL